MGGKGIIWAFDRDAKRLDRLKTNAAATGATNIVAQQVYFLPALSIKPVEVATIRSTDLLQCWLSLHRIELLCDATCQSNVMNLADGPVILVRV